MKRLQQNRLCQHFLSIIRRLIKGCVDQSNRCECSCNSSKFRELRTKQKFAGHTTFQFAIPLIPSDRNSHLISHTTNSHGRYLTTLLSHFHSCKVHLCVLCPVCVIHWQLSSVIRFCPVVSCTERFLSCFQLATYFLRFCLVFCWSTLCDNNSIVGHNETFFSPASYCVSESSMKWNWSDYKDSIRLM